MRDLTVEMVDPLGQVVRECAYKPRPARKSIALTYAFALRQEVPVQGSVCPPAWRAANEAILAAYGPKGLAAIKELAWAYAEGRKVPDAR